MTRRRILLGAFGDPGHAFPMIALGAELARRGHDVHLQTWKKWATHVEREGMTFLEAPEYHVFPTRDRPLKPYEAVVKAARVCAPLIEEISPQCVIADILTLAPAIAGEMAGVPVGTLIPHVDPRPSAGFPPYSIGARFPRTRCGRTFWRQTGDRVVAGGLERGRQELNETRRRVGLPPQGHVHNGISRALALVATVPQLEYPRAAPEPNTHVVGPLMWELDEGETVEPPGGRDGSPVVLLAPSTSQDPENRLLRAALEGLSDEPVRVIASLNRGELSPSEIPANAVVVPWLSYSRTMPLADVVVCHAGHGTVMRALASGCALVACPAAGDMGENSARIDWAGLGTRLPRRLITPRGVRLAVRKVLEKPEIAQRVRDVADWCATHDGPATAADLVERFGASGGSSSSPSPPASAASPS